MTDGLLLLHTGFAGLDNNRAVCDFGIKEFNHELVLQSVEKVNVPHPWPILGEHMGDLCTKTHSMLIRISNIFENEMFIRVCVCYLFPGVRVALQVLFRVIGVLLDDCLTIGTQELHIKLIDAFMKLAFLIPNH